MCFDGENPEWSEEMWRKARKEHKCYECRKVITKGELYHVFKGVWQGDFQEFKICGDCEELRTRIYNLEISHGCRSDESSVPFGTLMDVVKEYKLA